MKCKILIVDDHLLFNDGMKALLNETFTVVGQVFNGKNVLETVHTTAPDIVLLDINLPSNNGFEIAKMLRESFPKVQIIFLTMYNEKRFVEQAKELGVDGYLLKDSTQAELLHSIKTVWNGNQYYDKKLLQNESKNVHHNDYFVKRFSLSPREIEIIQMIKQGFSNPEIAKKLFIGEETVKSHRKNIYYKLDITKVTELIAFAEQNGL
jgi:DNA-binding NarL/FixJ family response regulator